MTDIHVKTRLQTSDCKSLSIPVTFLLTIFNICFETACFVHPHKAGRFLLPLYFKGPKRCRSPPLLKSGFFPISEETVAKCMGFNYAKEKAKFDAKWKKLRAEYEDAGMCQEDIQAMRDYDWNVFCSDRVYRNHTQALPDELLAGEERDGLNMLFRNYVTLSTSFGIEDFEERFAWLDTIRSKRFHSKLLALSPKDLELLTFIVLEGHDQHELAQKWRCTQSAISQRLKKIKLFLK